MEKMAPGPESLPRPHQTERCAPEPSSPHSTASCKHSSGSSLWQHLTADVRPSMLAEVELLILTFFTGLQGKPRVQLPESNPSPHS